LNDQWPIIRFINNLLAMFITQSFRKIRRLHYSCIDAIVPFKNVRWALTASLVLAFAATSKDICSDLNTYLVGFYLLMLGLNYFLPRGVSHDLEESFEEDE
jgi:hypothetical protein